MAGHEHRRQGEAQSDGGQRRAEGSPQAAPELPPHAVHQTERRRGSEQSEDGFFAETLGDRDDQAQDLESRERERLDRTEGRRRGQGAMPIVYGNRLTMLRAMV